jgi:DNA-binding CsgD family transcriptional regulator/PAS domain-containing protein
VLQRSPLPLAVFDLETLLLVDANAAAGRVIGRDLPITEPVALGTLLTADDAAGAAHALQLVADGTIHAYEAHRKILRSDGTVVDGHVWVRSIAQMQHAMALVVFMPDRPGDTPEDLEEIDDVALPGMRLALSDPMAVGTMEIDTRVVRISAEIEKLVGERPGAVRDTLLIDRLHPDDVATFLMALGRALDDSAGVGMQVRLRRARGDYVPVRMLVSPSKNDTGTRLGIVMTRDKPADVRDDDRVAELEQHLWRIGLEVQAAGVADGMHGMPDVAQVPGLEELSTRQWQILMKLLQGERVPDIARSLYVSQSTIRSHLAAMFRKLGVHSQAELISLFRDAKQQNV